MITTKDGCKMMYQSPQSEGYYDDDKQLSYHQKP
jgi:hypothetical protein